MAVLVSEAMMDGVEGGVRSCVDDVRKLEESEGTNDFWFSVPWADSSLRLPITAALTRRVYRRVQIHSSTGIACQLMV